MSEEVEKVYTRRSSEIYTTRQRILITLADWAFYLLITIVGATVKYETLGEECLQRLDAIGKLPIIVAWHDRIFLGAYFLRGRGLVFLTSKSFDGEYIARFLLRLGFGVVRGSSSRGGTRALVEMVREMKRGHAMGFIVDGPRGPRYVAKPGAIILARKTGNPIVPFVIAPRRYFTIKSWDRLQIARPFTTALVIYGKPIYVDSSNDDDTTESKRQELQRALDELVAQSEKWRKKVV